MSTSNLGFSPTICFSKHREYAPAGGVLLHIRCVDHCSSRFDVYAKITMPPRCSPLQNAPKRRIHSLTSACSASSRLSSVFVLARPSSSKRASSSALIRTQPPTVSTNNHHVCMCVASVSPLQTTRPVNQVRTVTRTTAKIHALDDVKVSMCSVLSGRGKGKPGKEPIRDRHRQGEGNGVYHPYVSELFLVPAPKQDPSPHAFQPLCWFWLRCTHTYIRREYLRAE